MYLIEPMLYTVFSFHKQKYWYIEACSCDQFPPQRQTVIHVSSFIEVFYGITAPRLTMRCVVWMAVCQCFQPASYMLNFSWVAWSSPFLILKLTKNSSCHLLVTYFLTLKVHLICPHLSLISLNLSSPLNQKCVVCMIPQIPFS